jgi:beta-glucanase (GH16 family)
MKIKLLSLTIAISVIAFGSCKEDDQVTTGSGNNTNDPAGYSLVWSDEFDGEIIDASKWVYETGDGTDYGLPAGCGNEEKQIYTNSSDNSSITMDDGNSVLAITALKPSAENYTSAKLTTNGLQSFYFGRVDIRAKTPAGNGLWPAIWLLGENRPLIDWPGCGEVDIMEILGRAPDTMFTTIHYVNSENKKGESQKAHTLGGANFSDDYHVYSLEWTPNELQFSLDGVPIYQEQLQTDMKEFLRPHYLILNLAIGGYWPGNPDASTPFPSSLNVDYVRYYSIDGLNIPSPAPLDTNEERLGPIIEPSIADAAIKDGFIDFGAISVTPYGAGGEPNLRLSDTAIDGSESLVYDFPGGNWGGAYIELDSPKDLSNYTSLRFALNAPASLDDAEIKLEAVSGSSTLMLKDYSPSPLSNGFVEYNIPLSDFNGMDFTNVRIPFAIWNAMDASQNFSPATVYVDRIYFEN